MKANSKVVAIAAIVLVVVFGGVSLAATPASLATTTSDDVLQFARQTRALCQVELDLATTDAQRSRAQHCLDDTDRAIGSLTDPAGATPSADPSAAPAPRPTASPTGGATPPQTTAPAPGPLPTSTSPTTPSGGWPGPNNTGVPVGTVLSAYTGPCTITVPGTIIDAKVVNCDLAIHTFGVIIKRSKVNGSIGDDETDSRSFSVIDSEVSAGPEQHPAVWHTNFTVLRSNIHGGQTAVGCVDLCVVKDSWLHGQVISVAGQHLGGFLSNGGGSVSTPSLIQHNTIVCDSPQVGSGDATASCSGDINLFGDFGGVHYYTIDNNLLQASEDISYCIYGGSSSAKEGVPDHIVFTDNVIQRGTTRRCGWWGAVADFDESRPGNVWSGNVWDDGTPLNP